MAKKDKSVSDDQINGSEKPLNGNHEELKAEDTSDKDNVGTPTYEELFDKNEELEKQYKNKQIPRPEFWGGFAIEVNYWEFWQGRRNRTHDRFCYNQINSGWDIERMAP